MIELPFSVGDLPLIIPNTQMGRNGWVWVTVPSRVYYCPLSTTRRRDEGIDELPSSRF